MLTRPNAAGLAGAGFVLALGVGGMLKMGRFHWGILIVTLGLAIFTFRSQRNAAKFREQFPNGVPRKPLL